MLYANFNKIHLALFWISIIFSIISPSYNQEVVQAKSEEKTSSGVEWKVLASISGSGKVDTKKELDKGKQVWVGEVLECNVECKVKTLIDIGIREEIAESLVTNCKALAENPVHCILVGASIVKNESWGWFKCRKANRFNCFGIMVGDEYKSFNDGVLHFVWKYNKWWYKANSMAFFYPPKNQVSKSRFCTSEDSSGSKIWCPHWLENSSYVFNILQKKF